MRLVSSALYGSLWLLIVSCSDSEAEMSSNYNSDPVFRAARADPQLRRRLDSKEARDAMTDPTFRRQLGAELSEKLYPHPDPGTIDELEKLLDGRPCVGTISRWHRIYANGINDELGGVDPAKVRFRFSEAGRHGVVAGRKIVHADELVSIDDRDIRVVHGAYDRRTGSVNVEFCGPNLRLQG
jgi:hypothetical protein